MYFIITPHFPSILTSSISVVHLPCQLLNIGNCYQLKPVVYIRLYCLCCNVHPTGFNKCIMTYIHHYSIIQNSFTTSKISCALLFHLCFPLPETLATTDFPVSVVLSFHLNPLVESYNAMAFSNGFFHLALQIPGFSMSFHDLRAHFFKFLKKRLNYRYTTVFFIHSSTEEHPDPAYFNVSPELKIPARDHSRPSVVS